MRKEKFLFEIKKKKMADEGSFKNIFSTDGEVSSINLLCHPERQPGNDAA
ncbi:hypothetical protein [Mesorhizobium kowhaii]|nr:hypothetical protein [Mesorhizobium kowhaii]